MKKDINERSLTDFISPDGKLFYLADYLKWHDEQASRNSMLAIASSERLSRNGMDTLRSAMMRMN